MGKKHVIYDTVYVKTITNDTKENLDGVKALSDNFVIKNAKKANKMIEDMKNKAEREKIDNKKLAHFIKQLREVIKFYEYVSSKNRVETTRKELVDYYNATKSFYNDIDKILVGLNNDLSGLNSELACIPVEKTRENSLRRQSVESQIRFTNNAIAMLHDFKACYSNLMPALDKVKDDVDYFILAISESVKVYRKALQNAELQQNISRAIDTIQQFDELNNLSNQIAESWRNLEDIMDQLASIQSSIAA